jgi:hypothetical protein
MEWMWPMRFSAGFFERRGIVPNIKILDDPTGEQRVGGFQASVAGAGGRGEDRRGGDGL